jgi:hypothetical protein
VSLVGLVELDVGPLRDGLREREARRNHQRIVRVPGNRVLLGELRGHLRLVLVGPGHEQDRTGAVLDHNFALFLGVLIENTFQLRVDGALAAVHHDDRVELLAGLVERDLVVADEGVFADSVRPEVRVHVVPVHA